MFTLLCMSGLAAKGKSPFVGYLPYSAIFASTLESFVNDIDQFDPIIEIVPLTKDEILGFANQFKDLFTLFSENGYPAKPTDPSYKAYSEKVAKYYDAAKRFVNNDATLNEFLPQRALYYFEELQKVYNHLNDDMDTFLNYVLSYFKFTSSQIQKIKGLWTTFTIIRTTPLNDLYKFVRDYFKKSTLKAANDYNDLTQYIYNRFIKDVVDKFDGTTGFASIQADVAKFEDYIQEMSSMTAGNVLQTYHVMNNTDFLSYVDEVYTMIPTVDALKDVNLQSVVEKVPEIDAITILTNVHNLDPDNSKFSDIENAMMIDPTNTTASKKTKSSKTTLIIICVCAAVGVIIIATIIGVVISKKKKNDNLSRTNLLERV